MLKYYYIYKITCLCGRFKDSYYYGKHEATKLDDNYFCSGRKINDYIKKYGRQGCKREIICYFNSREELNQKEYEIIHECLNDPKCLNIAEGGHGYPLQNLNDEEKKDTFNKISQSNKKRIHINNGVISKMIHQEELDYYISLGWKKGRITDYIDDDYIQKQKDAQTGKVRSIEFRRNLSEKMKGSERPEELRKIISLKLKGRKKTEETKEKIRGARWMTNGIERHYVLKDKIEYYLSQGYYFGMN